MTATPTPQLSIIAIFHDMRREAARTLYSLSAAYQRGVSPGEYEVLAIDNGSAAPLDPGMVRSFGEHFHYHYYPTSSPSPVAAVHHGAGLARGTLLSVMVDGAHLLSPGVVGSALWLGRRLARPFIAVPAFHLGPAPQNQSRLAGYDQAVEDRLLEQLAWRDDGYRLFSSCAASDRAMGWFGAQFESNCFTLSRALWQELEGLDLRFQSRGGGLCNLDLFQRAMAAPEVDYALLLGEGSFHQYHGGVATNAPPDRHPWAEFHEEYVRIRQKPFALTYRAPIYYGQVAPAVLPLLSRSAAAAAEFWRTVPR